MLIGLLLRLANAPVAIRQRIRVVIRAKLASLIRVRALAIFRFVSHVIPSH